MKRRLEMKAGSTQKFWSIERSSATRIVNFGRIGTNGQTKTKTFASAAEAKASADKLVAQKLRKGSTDAGPAPGAVPGG